MTISLNKRWLVAFQVWFWEYTCTANDVLHLLCTNTETSCWTIQNMEWSSVLVYPWLVYPIYALQCLHAIVDTMSILRKRQSFLYLKSYNIPSWASLYTECCCLGVIFCLLFLKSLCMHGTFLWGDLDHDQWSKITHMVHQRNRWICDQRSSSVPLMHHNTPVILDHRFWSR